MDPQTAFSLAAGILQVVDFSFRAVRICRELRKNGSLAEHDDTQKIASALATASNRLKTTLNQEAKPQSQDDVQIIDLSAKCSKLAEELLEELQELRCEQDSRLQVIKKGFRAIGQKSSLDAKQDLLEKYRRVLGTCILIRLDARSLQETQRSLQETQHIQSLDQAVRDLALALEQGQQLLASQSQQLKDHIDSKLDNHAQATEDRLAHQRLLESLFFPDLEARQERIPGAYQNTCRWVFDLSVTRLSKTQRWSNFRDWLETGNGAYWISGKPGSGKSTLMNHIVNEDATRQLLDRWKQGTELLIVSFFFWNAGTTLQKSCTGLLRSLLYQIARQWPKIVDLVDGNSRSLLPMATWTDQRLLSLLQRFLDKKPSEVSLCAFVDGLDEFVGDEDLLLDIVRLFSKTSRCKICVSSRPEQAFREEFQMCPQLRAQDFNYLDIVQTAYGRLFPVLTKSYGLPANDSKVTSLVDLLIRKASGVFLWVDLMIKDLIRGLRNGDTFDELRLRLERTPDTINGMYAHLLQSLDPLYQEEAFKNFLILIAANDMGERVTLLTLILAEGEPWEHISQYEPGYFSTPRFQSVCRTSKLRLVTRCGNFIEIDEPREPEENFDTVNDYNRRVDFVHRTAMDYVRKEHRRLDPTSSWQLRAHDLVARGYLGALALNPAICKDEEWPDSEDRKKSAFEDLAQPIKIAMLAIRTLGFSKDDGLTQSPQIELVNQAVQVLLHPDLWEGIPRHGLPDAKNDLRRVVKALHPDISFIDSRTSDPLDFAAFFGCNLYVKSEMPTGVVGNEQIWSLLLNAKSGIDLSRDYRSLPRLWTIREIVQPDFDPNELIIQKPWDSWEILSGTIWARVFDFLLTVFMDAGTSDGRLETIGREIIARLLSLGANPNTRCVAPRLVTDHDGCDVLWCEFSPLGMWACHTLEVRSVLPSIEPLLLSAGCVRYAEVRYIQIRGTYYPVSHDQSQRIMDALAPRTQYSSRLWTEPDEIGKTEFKDITAEIKTGDSIDEEVVLKDILELKESF
ncbi:MAG: hypothetical protein Q9193_002384 [Seirophora villosa]